MCYVINKNINVLYNVGCTVETSPVHFCEMFLKGDLIIGCIRPASESYFRISLFRFLNAHKDRQVVTCVIINSAMLRNLVRVSQNKINGRGMSGPITSRGIY